MSLLDAPERFEEVAGESVAWGKAQGRNAIGVHQLGRHKKQALPQPLQRGPLEVRRNTETLEPIQLVVASRTIWKKASLAWDLA